jgi:hypothetical protein
MFWKINYSNKKNRIFLRISVVYKYQSEFYYCCILSLFKFTRRLFVNQILKSEVLIILNQI